MAGHASNMIGGRIQSDHGCGGSAADRYHIFSDVDGLYGSRRRHGGDVKKTGRLFRPAGDVAELPAPEASGMTAAAGRYGGLFPPSAASVATDSATPYGKFGARHKSGAGGGSLVDALNDALSPPNSGGNRSDCSSDVAAASPLAAVNGGVCSTALMGAGAGGGSSLFSGSFGYDVVDDVGGIYRRSMTSRDDGTAAFRPHVGCYPFSPQSYLGGHSGGHHQPAVDPPSSFMLRQPVSDHPSSSSLLPHQHHHHQQQQQSGSSIFYGQGSSSGLTDADGTTTSGGGRVSSPADGRTRRYFSPAVGYFGAAAAPSGGVIPAATYGAAAESAVASRYDGALGSLNSYFQRGAFGSPGMATAFHHLVRSSLPVFP